MRPTDEQQAALAAFSTGDDLVIVAGAGTGKTSTLRLLAGSTSRRGLYLAFNKAIAEEAKAAFPRSVQARTAHSLAYGWAARQGGYRPVLQRLGRPRRHPQALVEALGLADMRIPTATGEVTFGAGHVLRWVSDILAAFLQSADEDIDPARHRPLIPGTSAGVVDEVAAALAPAVARAWDDLRSAQGVMPMTTRSTSSCGVWRARGCRPMSCCTTRRRMPPRSWRPSCRPSPRRKSWSAIPPSRSTGSPARSTR